MWQRIKRRPQLAIVASAGIFVLIVAVLAPVIGPRLHAARPSTPASAHAGHAAPATPRETATPQGTFFQASPHVQAQWGDSTTLVMWDAIPGAAGYVVTLIRSRDLGIMERFTVPASQRMGDAQGIWPNEMYQVAVQPLAANGTAGAPEFSAPGQSVPISRQSYNGFLDTMGLPAGSLDNNLWDIRQFIPNISSSASFINDQIHGHLETGQFAYEQSMIGMTARVPVDFTSRTAHIHGEVDLHGNFGTWFTVNLTPTMISPNQLIDTDDRGYNARSLPILTLFDGQPGMHGTPGDVKLFESVGNGQAPVTVVGDMMPDFSFNNVRNTVDYYVSTTHVKVVIDGQTLADVNLPYALPFSVAYLNLSAESYPKVDDNAYGHVLPCDDVGGACNVWHLDNWGFDAPAGHVQPATTVNFARGCTPTPSVPDKLLTDQACSDQQVNTGTTASYVVPVADASQTQSVQVVTQQYSYDMTAMQHLQVSVNGGQWIPLAFLDTAQPYAEVGAATIPTSLLHTGNNTVRIRATADNGGTQVGNVVLQQVRTFPFTPPPLPPEAAPSAFWH